MLFDRKMFCAAVLVGMMGAAPPAFADEPEIELEHGKINMPDPSPVDSGHYEVEAAYSYGYAKRLWDNNGHSRSRGWSQEHGASLAVVAGLADNFDMAIGGSYSWLTDKDNDFDDTDSVSGPHRGNDFGDVDVSARYRFLENEEWKIEAAYIGGLTLPTGSESDAHEIGTSQEYYSFNQTVVMSKDWRRLTANMDVGFALPFGARRGNARGTFNADAAAGYQVLPWLQPEIELNYAYDFIDSEDDADVLAVTAGLVMPIDENWRVNAGIQQAIRGHNADKSTTISVAIKTGF